MFAGSIDFITTLVSLYIRLLPRVHFLSYLNILLPLTVSMWKLILQLIDPHYLLRSRSIAFRIFRVIVIVQWFQMLATLFSEFLYFFQCFQRYYIIYKLLKIPVQHCWTVVVCVLMFYKAVQEYCTNGKRYYKLLRTWHDILQCSALEIPWAI